MLFDNTLMSYIGPCTVACYFKLKKQEPFFLNKICSLFWAGRLGFGVKVFYAGPKCDFLYCLS